MEGEGEELNQGKQIMRWRVSHNVDRGQKKRI